jgi:aromatic ring-cleaving dioxygenase
MDKQIGRSQSPGLQLIQEITSYHAHIYFNAGTRDAAAVVRQQIAERFAVQMGRWHDRPVGPHAQPMYQVAFSTDLFTTLVPWLMLNRQGLSVLVHPNTGRPRQDHEVHALWLGLPLPLETAGLPETGAVTPQVMPNTEPTIVDI